MEECAIVKCNQNLILHTKIENYAIKKKSLKSINYLMIINSVEKHMK